MLKNSEVIVMNKVRFASNEFDKIKGLMFEKESRFDYGLVFDFGKEVTKESSVHMLFVFFPITILFLNKQRIVLDKVVMKPFELNYTPNCNTQFIIELPVSKQSLVKIGDKLDW